MASAPSATDRSGLYSDINGHKHLPFCRIRAPKQKSYSNITKSQCNSLSLVSSISKRIGIMNNRLLFLKYAEGSNLSGCCSPFLLLSQNHSEMPFTVPLPNTDTAGLAKSNVKFTCKMSIRNSHPTLKNHYKPSCHLRLINNHKKKQFATIII